MTNEKARLRVAVWGLGYVGCVATACLAELGHRVNGIDVDPNKVRLVNQGLPTIVEKDIDDLMAKNRAAISACESAPPSLEEVDVSLVCVGTPNAFDGSLDLTTLFKVADTIASKLSCQGKYHVVVIRSTVPPGTCDLVAQIMERVSGLQAGRHFDVVSNPEFLREGSAVKDYLHPPYTVVGTRGESPEAMAIMRRLYEDLDAPFLTTDVQAAELIKFVNNSWHALKISFANEIGNICKKSGIDAREVMHLFCQDTILNISPYYLKPGYAFGGSCLPKDLRGLQALARRVEAVTPVLDSIEPSNNRQVEEAFRLIATRGRRTVAFLGVSFKSGTDDVRLSPKLALCHKLIRSGYTVRVHDGNVSRSLAEGINHKFLISRLEEVASLLQDNLSDVLSGAEVVILANNEPEYRDLSSMLQPGQFLFELERLPVSVACPREGICW